MRERFRWFVARRWAEACLQVGWDVRTGKLHRWRLIVRPPGLVIFGALLGSVIVILGHPAHMVSLPWLAAGVVVAVAGSAAAVLRHGPYLGYPLNALGYLLLRGSDAAAVPRDVCAQVVGDELTRRYGSPGLEALRPIWRNLRRTNAAMLLLLVTIFVSALTNEFLYDGSPLLWLGVLMFYTLLLLLLPEFFVVLLSWTVRHKALRGLGQALTISTPTTPPPMEPASYLDWLGRQTALPDSNGNNTQPGEEPAGR